MLRFSFSVSWGCAAPPPNVEVSFSANTWPMELPLKLVVEGNITFRSFEDIPIRPLLAVLEPK